MQKTKFVTALAVPAAVVEDLDAAARDAGVTRTEAFLAIVRGVDVRAAVLAGLMIENDFDGAERQRLGFHLPPADHQRLAAGSAGVEMQRLGRLILTSQRARFGDLVAARQEERSDETNRE